MQQSEITRSLASETLQFEQSLREQLLSQRQMLALTGWIQNVDDPTHAPQLSRLLQDFVENNPNILYVTAVNKEAKGQSAGSFSADHDPFVEAALKRAFTSSIQGFDSHQRAVRAGQGQSSGAGGVRAVAVGRPVRGNVRRGGFARSAAGAHRDASVRDRTVYIVDVHGQIVAYPDTRELVPGRDVTSTSPLVKQITRIAARIARHANHEFRHARQGRAPSRGNDRHLQHDPGTWLGRDRAAQPGRRARGRRRNTN